MFRLDNRVAVVIGGAGGLGKACASALARQGAEVIIASRNLEKLNEVAASISPQTGSEVVAMQVDVGVEESIANLTERVIRRFGTVDVLVNAQGINLKIPAVDISVEVWDSLFAINVRGVFLACKHFGKIMIEKRRGKIINLSSVRGIRAAPRANVAYGASKGAVDMITRMLAAEWAEYHVNVNAIGPSIVVTEMMRKVTKPERLCELESSTLFKRFATPEDVGAACVYLASAESDYITGQVIYVDGGLTAVG